MYPKNKPLPPEAASRAAEVANRSSRTGNGTTAVFRSKLVAGGLSAASCGEGTVWSQPPLAAAPGHSLHIPANQAVPPPFVGAQRLSPVSNSSFPSTAASAHNTVNSQLKVAKPPPPYVTVPPASSGYREEPVSESFGHMGPSHYVWGSQNRTPPPFQPELPPYPDAAVASAHPHPRRNNTWESSHGVRKERNGRGGEQRTQASQGAEATTRDAKRQNTAASGCGEKQEVLLQKYHQDISVLSQLLAVLLDRMHPGDSRTTSSQGDCSAGSISLTESLVDAEAEARAADRQLKELESAITATRLKQVTVSPNIQKMIGKILSVPQHAAGALKYRNGSDDALSRLVSSEVKAFMQNVDFETTCPLMLNVMMVPESSLESQTSSRTMSLQGVSAQSGKEGTAGAL
uniref:Uncharacterized protein n=1 Tax=Trypanosoma congolense (strain IL3000) TaxID=1068625 RepID=G0UYR1_TRYCI|nr:conserved hypothetical protein [Trypanosoma congolense IL3000]